MTAAVPIFWDGFDHYNTSAILLQKWNGGTSGTWTVPTTSGRRGTGCASVTSGGWILRILPSALSTVMAGVANRVPTTPGASTSVLDFADTGVSNTTVQIALSIDANMAIRAYRGTPVSGTLLGTSANAVIPADSYYYLEAKVFIHATTGTVHVRVNGVEVLALTGQNTKNTAASTISQIALIGSVANHLFDDFYVADATTNTDFLGDQRVDTSYPTSDGFYQTWTPSTGTDHFSLVNATAPQMTTYVSDGTAANKDTYNVTDLLAITGTIAGVQITAYAQKSDAGARSLKLVTRSNTTDVSSSSQTLGTSPNLYSAIQLTDPNTAAAWTESGFNAAQFGVETV
jgi:hypothetical protein